MKVEQQHLVGAGHYQRSSHRRCYRNGYYTRNVVWKLEVLSKVLIPRTRSGNYESAIIERNRRFGGRFDRHILPLFTLGLSTRRVEQQFFGDFFGQYGIGSQTVSDILKRVTGGTGFNACYPVTVIDYFVVSARSTTFFLLAEKILADLAVPAAHDPVITAIFLPTSCSASKPANYVSEVETPSLDSISPQNPEMSTADRHSRVLERITPSAQSSMPKLKVMEEEFQRKLEELQKGN